MTQRMESCNKGLAKEMASTWQALGKHLARCWHTLSCSMSLLRVWQEYGKEQARSRQGAGKSMLRVCLGHAGRIQAEFGENSRRIQGEFRLNSQRMHLLRFVACLILIVVGVGEVWGQSLPFEVTTDDDVTNHTEKFYWIESVGGKGFHIVPNYENNNASTTNAPTMRALWYFKASGEDGYYYIINKETGTYLKKTGKAGDNGTIQVATYASADDVKFKFSFGTPEGITQGSWVIYPKYDTGNGTGWVGKRSGNLQFANGYGLKASNWNNTPVGDLNSQWIFVARNNVQWPQSGLPFVVSTNSDKHYYNINHVRNSTYNVSYDNSNYVTISTDNDNKTAWYFLEAATDANIDNLKYYYIMNASSEKYLKFTATTINGSNQNDKFVLSDYDSGNEDRFQFVVVNSYDNQGNSWYSIMPKLAMSKYDVSNFANSMAPSSVANNEKLDLRSDRNTDKGHWTFKPVWGEPMVTCDETGTITITGEDGAAFYYTTDGSTVPTTGSTQYNANNKPTVSEGITTIKVRAIADGKSPSGVVTQKIVYVPNQTFSSTYNGNTQVPIVEVNNTTISSDEFNVSYQQAGIDVLECMNTGTYTVEITDKDGGEYIVYGSGSFTINQKALTITAGSETKVYDGTALTKNSYTNTDLATGDNIESVTITGSQTVVGSCNNVPSVAVIKKGETNVTANYNITYANGTLEVTQKALTITADSDTKEYDGEPLTKSTFTSSGLVEGDEIISVTVTGSQTDRGSSDNVPSEALIKNNNGEGVDVTACYEITYVKGTLTVTGRPITITAGSDTKVYDGSALTNDSYTYDGTLYSGDEIASVTVTGNQTIAGSSDNVPSAASIMNGENDVTDNYTVTYINGTLEVTQKALTITAKPKTITYGDAPDNDGLTYSGFVNNETESVLGGTPAYAYNYNQYDNVGSYTITPSGLTATNYAITFNTGTLTVEQKEIGLNWQNTSLTYSGTAQAPTSTATGIVNSDEISVTVTGTQTNVGTGYIATALGLTGTKADNYKLPAANTTTFEITTKELTITADGATKVYDGTALTKNSYTNTDLGTGDAIESVTITGSQTDVGSSNNVPSGAIIKKGESVVTGNYNITYANGTLTVTQKSIGDGSIATGFSYVIESDNSITLKDGETTLIPDPDDTDADVKDYFVASGSEPTSSGKYTTRTVSGRGNYTGFFNIRNAIVHLKNDNNGGNEYSATFVAENAGATDIGHALPEGISAYIITDITGDWAIPEQLDYIPAGVPVLLLANEEINGFEVKNAVLSNDVTKVTETQIGNNMLEEVTETTTGYVNNDQSENYQKAYFDTKQIYLLYNNEFVWNKAGYLAKWKVYLNPNHTTPTPDPDPDPDPEPSPAPSRLKIAWHRTSDISNIPTSAIEGRSQWYTIDGRRLSGKPSVKGLYIVEGKKVMVR